MKRQIRQLLGMSFLCAVLAITGKPLKAQGFSYGDMLDDVNIQTYVDYYEGGVSSCGPIVLSSTLDDVTVPVPEGETVYQEVNPTVPAVEYVFTITIVVNVTGPYGGCEQFEDTLTVTLATHNTYYVNGMPRGTAPNQYCYWVDVVCNPVTSTPACVDDVTSLLPCSGILGVVFLVENKTTPCDGPQRQSRPADVGVCN